MQNPVNRATDGGHKSRDARERMRVFATGVG